MSIKSNGKTFFIPAAMQLARGEDFARGMNRDTRDGIDYRAMLARTLCRSGEYTDTRPTQAEILTCETEMGQTLREVTEFVYSEPVQVRS